MYLMGRIQDKIQNRRIVNKFFENMAEFRYV
jgi:hypothetical protein